MPRAWRSFACFPMAQFQVYWETTGKQCCTALVADHYKFWHETAQHTAVGIYYTRICPLR